MMGQTIPAQNFQTPHDLTPRDDVKKIVSEILKRADQLIRKGDLDLAQMEIYKSKDIDPRNVYALALEERISTLKTEVERLNKKHDKETVIQSSPAEKKTKPEEKPTVSREPAKTDTTPPPASLIDSIAAARKDQEPQQERVLDRSIELESYRKALTEAWSDGSLNADEKKQLNDLQMLFEITEAEHEGIEKSVQRECYKNAIIRHISNNPLALSNTKSLAELQSAFSISEDEHLQIQAQLMNLLQQKQRNKILVIDDDMRLLELIAASLEDNGFDVTALSTSDEAYALLRKFVPDLILCDINLETSTMGGFTFYEKVQELKSVQSVPFVFLTGLTDEALVRTSKELGVDDYLIKPISEQTLVSTLRGKLKRFKQLKSLSGISMSTTAV
jgi:CheY-like chemotaxis protein